MSCRPFKGFREEQICKTNIVLTVSEKYRRVRMCDKVGLNVNLNYFLLIINPFLKLLIEHI